MSSDDSAKILKEIRNLFDDAVPPMVVKTVEEIMPTFEQSMKSFSKGMRDLIILELTGEEYKDRSEVKRGIQWAIKSSQNTSTFKTAAIVAGGSAVGGGTVFAVMYLIGV